MRKSVAWSSSTKGFENKIFSTWFRWLISQFTLNPHLCKSANRTLVLREHLGVYLSLGLLGVSVKALTKDRSTMCSASLFRFCYFFVGNCSKVSGYLFVIRSSRPTNSELTSSPRHNTKWLLSKKCLLDHCLQLQMELYIISYHVLFWLPHINSVSTAAFMCRCCIKQLFDRSPRGFFLHHILS